MPQVDLRQTFGPELAEYGIQFDTAGGLPEVKSQTPERSQLKNVNALQLAGMMAETLGVKALGNLILRQDGVEEFVQDRPQTLPEFRGGKYDSPLVPTQSQTAPPTTPPKSSDLPPYTPPRDPTPATTTTPTFVDGYGLNNKTVQDILAAIPGYQERVLQGELKKIEGVAAEAIKRDNIAEWGAITRAQIARDQALAQSLMVTSVYANTPNVSVMQAMNATAPSVIGAYKMGSSVLK